MVTLLNAYYNSSSSGGIGALERRQHFSLVESQGDFIFTSFTLELTR